MESQEIKEIMISVNPPYSTMIISGKKKIEFRKICILNLRRGDKLWFYETKNKGGTGRIIGSATLEALMPLSAIYDPWGSCKDCFIKNYKLFWNFCFDRDYSVPYAPDFDWVRNIRDKMQEVFSKYSEENDKEFLKEIGASGNYALLFNDFQKKDLVLNDFMSVKSNSLLKHPPQNMCRVIRNKNKIKK